MSVRFAVAAVIALHVRLDHAGTARRRQCVAIVAGVLRCDDAGLVVEIRSFESAPVIALTGTA